MVTHEEEVARHARRIIRIRDGLMASDERVPSRSGPKSRRAAHRLGSDPRQQMRSVLATLGIVIGIVTVTLMATAMESLNRAFREAISFLSTDVLYVISANGSSAPSRSGNVAKRAKITRPQVEAVERENDRVRASCPRS